ncbi:MAG: peptide chain release factor 2 [Actinobacteria bacterium]|nr:peptide chain release factor 2 [Actinomycetota bacterium]
MIEDYKEELDKIIEKFLFLKDCLDPAGIKKELGELESHTVSNDFWLDIAKASSVTKKINDLNDELAKIGSLEKSIENVKLSIELLQTEEDISLEDELKEEIKDIKTELESLEENLLFSEPYDSYPAIVMLHPGAGGTESADWAEMLFRMYKKWMDVKKFKYRIVDYQPGDEAGIKNVTFTVRGKNAYGFLKSEKGIHRLVRISPFDSTKRRHTSFALVDVIPLFEDEIEIEINKEDLRIDTFRSSSAGGQHVNVTDSAVRITHIPTNTIVSCQDERSQILNRQTAMQILKSKLYEHEIKKKEAELEKVRGEKKDIGWGNQIRSYTLQPYQLIKDHRTEVETGDVQSVLNGDIDLFIKGYLEKKLLKG